MDRHTLDISDRWAQETGDDESRVLAEFRIEGKPGETDMTMNTITDRLRRARNTTLPVGALWELCEVAADEIDRLREELATLREAEARLARDIVVGFKLG